MRTLFLLLLCAAVAVAGPASALLPLDDQRALDTGGFLAEYQHPDGGFWNSGQSGPLEIIPTALAVRAMALLEEDPVHRRHQGLFILSCYDPITGGFSPVANGEPQYRPTAFGLMALVWGATGGAERQKKAAAYLCANARTVEEIYLACLAHEVAKLKPATGAEWAKALNALRKPGGIYGSGPVDTAQAVVALKLLGAAIPNPGEVLDHLRSARRADGGYGKLPEHGDMETSYAAVRALQLLDAGDSDIEPVLGFLNRCRYEEGKYAGGYADFPGQEPAVIPTSLAVLILSLRVPPAAAAAG